MALNNAATIIPGRGTVFVGDPGAEVFDYKTVDPRDPLTYTGWDCLGHTSRENAVALAKDGGDATQQGSWWEESLRATYEATTWSATVNSLQVDQLTLGLAFGGGEVEDGAFWVPGTTTPVEKALYILCVDSTGRMGIYAPNAPITIGDAPTIAVDAFFEIQLSSQILSDPTTGRRIGFFHPSMDTPVDPSGD